MPSIAVSPVDTTGAGDAFIGCLLYQITKLSNFNTILENSDDLLKMVLNANKAGAITTTEFGAIAALPTLEELEI